MDKPLQCTLRLATYYATREDWEAVAKDLEEKGEIRLAKAIRSGMDRGWRKHGGYFGLRFRGGSIDKLDRYSDGS